MQRALISAALSVLGTGLVTALSSPAALSSPGTPRTSSNAGVRGDDIQIETKDLKLSGSYFAPRGKGRAPGVLLVHEAGADRSQLEDVAANLNRKGFGVLTLDLRGHGGSQTDRFNWAECDATDQSKLWQQSLRDVAEGAEWLLSQRDIHSTNLSLVGYRSGCALAARHAEGDENVVGMALISTKASEFGFDVKDSIQQVSGLPTLLVGVRDDDAERIATEANALSPSPYVTVLTIKKKGPTALDDSKTASKVSSFLSDVAMPKKGRG